jgi:choline dehydrogenase-like flavoprotein
MFDPSFAGGVKQTWKLFGQVPLGEGRQVSGVLMLGLPGNVRNALSELHLLVRGLTPRATTGLAPRIFRAAFASAREIGPLAWRYLRHRRLWTELRGVAVVRASIEQPERWENRIILGATRDKLGIPRVRIDWRTGTEEGKTFLTLANRASAWLEAVGAGRATIDSKLMSDPALFARSADDGLHHSGGTRMGLSPNVGVVDTDLQVHGTVGLFVCGASVFPRTGFANPTLTAAALGVRLADHLARTRSS